MLMSSGNGIEQELCFITPSDPKELLEQQIKEQLSLAKSTTESIALDKEKLVSTNHRLRELRSQLKELLKKAA